MNRSQETRLKKLGAKLDRFAVHVRAGTSFILTRSLRQKRKACPTCSYPGFVRAAGNGWSGMQSSPPPIQVINDRTGQLR
jgi:hypothetical protein